MSILEGATQPKTVTESRRSNLPAQSRSVVTLNRRVVTSPVEPNDQSFSGHTPSPNSYEFALHGLLALGSTSGAIGGVDLHPAPTVAGEQAVSIYDFASNENMDPTLEDNRIQEGPGVHRLSAGQQSTLNFDRIGYDTPGPTPDFYDLEHREELYGIDRAPKSNAIIPAEVPSTHARKAGYSLELLQFYRYQVAPWLDICDTEQHFGVALLTESTRFPTLRASVMKLAGAASSVEKELYVDSITSNGSVDDDVASQAAVKTIVDVLDVLADTVPSLAAFWSRRDPGLSRTDLLERLLLKLDSSSLDTCAYWLLVRLGKA